MINNRGTRYSYEHLDYTIKDKEFWDFSWDEIAKYDTIAHVEYIK